jgi:hypothetical protein
MDTAYNSRRWTSDEIKRVGYAVVGIIGEHITGLPDGPVFCPVPGLIERDISLAQELARLVEASDDLQLHVGLGFDVERLNALNKAILQDIQLSGMAFLSSTVVQGKFALRVCMVNHRASMEDMTFLAQLVWATGRRLV